MQMKMQMKMSQQLIMTPQLQQAIKLLQLSRAELEELIEQTLVENPVLEEGIDMDSFPGKKEETQENTETSENPEVVDDTENYETAREKEQENNYPAIPANNNKATILVILIIGLTAGPAVSLYGSPTVSPVTAALCASEPLPP